MERYLKTLAGWLVFALILAGGLEIALRAVPEAIPLTLLKRFHHEPRLEIARKRSLWNESQMQVVERDDGGPRLRILKPHSRISYDFHREGEKGTMVMDDQGFCNPPRDRYDRDKIDIIAIGDSFTWCVVTDAGATWASQLGVLTGRPVYNLGRGGIGPYAYLQILRAYGLAKHPDYVVMNIYEGNDLRDSIRYQEHVAAARHNRVLYRDAGDRNTREIDIDALLGKGPLRDSYAVNFVLAVVDKAYEGGKNAILRLIGGDAPEHVNFHYTLDIKGESVDFNVQNADESEVRLAHGLKAGKFDFSAFDDALRRFVAMGRQYGFEPVVSYSPSAYTGYADFVRFEDPELTELMPWFSRRQRAYLAGKAEELGYRFVDLTPAIQARARALPASELLYHPANVHFTILGNRVVAEILAHTIFNRPTTH